MKSYTEEQKNMVLNYLKQQNNRLVEFLDHKYDLIKSGFSEEYFRTIDGIRLPMLVFNVSGLAAMFDKPLLLKEVIYDDYYIPDYKYDAYLEFDDFTVRGLISEEELKNLEVPYEIVSR